MNDKIENAMAISLGLPVNIDKTVPVVQEDVGNTDFELARGNIKEIIDKGKRALDGILEVAKQSDHPRAYEVASTMIKALVDANRDLLALHKQNIEISPTKSSDIKVNNAIFVGSTAELQEIIKKNREEKEARLDNEE